MHERTLQCDAGYACAVIARIFQDIVQIGAQDSGALRQYDAKLGKQASDAVNTSSALFFKAFTQSMYTQHSLLV